jgi:hypothetical protein
MDDIEVRERLMVPPGRSDVRMSSTHERMIGSGSRAVTSSQSSRGVVESGTGSQRGKSGTVSER